LALLLFLGLGGCGTFMPSASQLKALTESDRSYCVSMIIPGMGTGQVMGTGIQNGTVECEGNKMKVQSAPSPAAK
jgi:hypothetical protein